MAKIPISVLITTKNEVKNLPRCLAALSDFEEVTVIDSKSADGTVDAARSLGVQVVEYEWDGGYPKKRQWCLDNLTLKHDWIFFVDADEELTPELIAEIKKLNFAAAGYFVKGCYVWNDQFLRFGVQNNKLALFDRNKIEFPVVDDLNIPGMGEIEGHYQPVLKPECADAKIRQLQNPLLHHAFEDPEKWQNRHQGYAHWEAEMTRRKTYPQDPVAWRQALKAFCRSAPYKSQLYFAYAYGVRLGFLDGAAGLNFALHRAQYYAYIRKILKTRND